MPNPYSIPLNPEAELGIIIQIEAGKKKQGHATFVILVLLEKYKKQFIEKWGQEFYDQLHAKYSLTVSEQKAIKSEKQDRAKRLREEQEKLENVIICHKCGEPYGSNPDNCKSCKKKVYEDATKKIKERTRLEQVTSKKTLKAKLG